MELQDNKVVRNKDEGNFVVRYIKSFFHALDGFIYSLKYEHNIIVILIAIIIVTICGFIYKISSFEWIACILLFGVILATELINSSIEATVDLETSKNHPLAKIAKDTASGASLVLCIAALIIGLIIFIPKIF